MGELKEALRPISEQTTRQFELVSPVGRKRSSVSRREAEAILVGGVAERRGPKLLPGELPTDKSPTRNAGLGEEEGMMSQDCTPSGVLGEHGGTYNLDLLYNVLNVDGVRHSYVHVNAGNVPHSSYREVIYSTHTLSSRRPSTT